MKGTFVSLGIAAAVAATFCFVFLVYVLLASSDADYWAGEIAEFERRDISNPPANNSVIFVGGRDIRQWETLSRDMAPLEVINRGFGGAHISHLTHFTSRIIKPYAPRAIVVIAGEEDLADVRGSTPEDVLDRFKIFISALRAHGVEADVVFVSIRPSPTRSSRWFGAKRANGLIEEFAQTRDDILFVDAASLMFDDAGNMRDEYFRWDGLSLSDEGYQFLTARLRPILMRRYFDD